MGGEMRKGGYAVVVGCANIDICGKSFRPVIERDSNPGLVSISYGGVGKNIAHNLSLLGGKGVHAHGNRWGQFLSRTSSKLRESRNRYEPRTYGD